MALKKLYITAATLFFAIAPSVAQDSEKIQTKMEEVMEAHDQVMDRMPELAKLIGKLETKADASNDKEKYHIVVKDLKAANKSMMDWMTGFGHRFEPDEMYKGKTLTEQKQKWLLEEEKKIARLWEEVISSIQRGKRLIQE